MPRNPFGNRDQFAVDHQHPVVEARDVALHDDGAALRLRLCCAKGDLHLRVLREIDRNPASVVAVQRLQHHRIADALCRPHRLVLAQGNPLDRDGQAKVVEDAVRLLLVSSDADRDLPGFAGDGRLNAALVLAVSKLDEAVLVEADVGDVPRLGGLHERCGAGAEFVPLRKADEGVALLLEVELRVRWRVELLLELGGQQVEQQHQRNAAGLQPHVALVVLEDHVVVGKVARGAGAPKGDIRPRHALHLNGDMLHHMPQPGALVLTHPTHKPSGSAVRTPVFAQTRQGFQERIDVTGAQSGRGPFLQYPQVQHLADHRKSRVAAGADIHVGFQNFHTPPVEG